ncbi:phosphotransferase [Gibbsiella quercinecans]|uniref:phosphotransferase n=1 Tax=Gibbsiella quercinecans TaxID=929813 RepID=UPI003A4E6681
MLTRLRAVLQAAGLDNPEITAGTEGVASPHRLAAEWAGYKVEHGGAHYYAKVLYDDQRELIDVAYCTALCQCAAQTGVTPQLHYADAAQGVMIFEALPEGWRWARIDDLIAPQQLHRLWQTKGRLHQGQLPAGGKTRFAMLAHLRQLCERDGAPLPDDTAWLDQCAEMATRALQQHAAEPVFIHGDGIASNVMLGPGGELKLVDFDYGGIGDRLYDMAILLNELFPFEREWREKISHWHGACSEEDYARCRLYAFIDDWYWTLWGFWVGHTSSRPLEFTKLGQWTLLRCRLCVRDPRFESWLRNVNGG